LRERRRGRPTSGPATNDAIKEREGANKERKELMGDRERKLMDFPCSYPLKVIGKNTNEFYSTVSAIIEKHVPDSSRISYTDRVSSGDKYLSITATFSAESQEQLTAIYRELSDHKLVLFTL
jgi:putative lipoic acid-binding regulatory protein